MKVNIRSRERDESRVFSSSASSPLLLISELYLEKAFARAQNVYLRRRQNYLVSSWGAPGHISDVCVPSLNLSHGFI